VSEGRFRLLSKLGVGSTSVVYSAYDTRYDQVVALKVFRSDAVPLARELLREFRILHGLNDRNLPRVYELVAFEGRPTLVMELFEGKDLGKLLGGACPTPAEVIRGLLSGLAVLHAHGLTHGDVKPANLLVRSDGRVALTDFGLSLVVNAGGPGLAGTLAYMPPELIWGEEPSPASDIYSAALVIAEVIAGECLSERYHRTVHLSDATARLVHERTAKHPLSALLHKMLSKNPADRPSAHEVLKEARCPIPEGIVWFGRAAELAQLWAWWSSKRHGCLVVGNAGIGKSALVARFASELRTRGVRVVATRCHEKCQIPFYTFEALFELIERRSGPTDPRHVELLDQVFGRSSVSPSNSSAWAVDPEALADGLLAALGGAAQEPTLWIIDDAQWLDPDCERLFARIAKRLPLKTVLVSRVGHSTVVARWRDELQTIVVDTLPAEETRVWLTARAAVPATQVEQLVTASRGIPSLIHLLCTYPAADGVVEELWQRRIGILSENCREILKFLAIVRCPVKPLHLMNAVCGSSWSDIRALEDAGLVTYEWGLSGPSLVVAHDSILGALSVDDLTADSAYAERLATAGAPAVLVATLYSAAGDHASASRYAADVLENAMERAAYEIAVHWAEYLVHWNPNSEHFPKWLERLGTALACLGQVLRAAQVLEEAATASRDDIQSHRLRALSAHLWLGAGRAREGIPNLRKATSGLGFPLAVSPFRARLTSFRNLVHYSLHGLQFLPTSDVAPHLSARLEAAWAAAGPLVFLDYETGVAALSSYLRLALAAGDINHACRAAALVWNALELSGRHVQAAAAFHGFLEKWGGQASDPNVTAFVTTMRGYAAIYSRHMGESLSLLDDGLAQYDPRRMDRWDRPLAKVNRLVARHFVGPTEDLVDDVEYLRAQLITSGNLLSVTILDLGVGYAADLVRDDVVAAHTRLDNALSVFDVVPDPIRWIAAFGRARINLYEGNPEQALSSIGPLPKNLANLQHVRVSHSWISALAWIMAYDHGNRRGLTEARTFMRRLSRERSHWGAGHDAALLGAVLARENDRDEATIYLEAALRKYTEAGLKAFLSEENPSRNAGAWRRMFLPDCFPKA